MTVIPAILAQIGIPALIELVTGALRKSDGGEKIADVLDGATAVLKQGDIQPETMSEANRHLEEMASIELKSLSEINQSLRTEAVSDDKFVRRMRPTFGYLMAATWAMQMSAIAYVIVFRTDKADIVLGSMESLSTIWMVGLSVLGIYVYKRSEEKKISGKMWPGKIPF